MASLQKIDHRMKDGGTGGRERAALEQGPQAIIDEATSQAISEAAYYRAEARGFER